MTVRPARLPDPPILIITDRSRCAEPLAARAEALFRGGCRWLSLREKDLAPAERRGLLAELRERARPFGATLSVHGDVEAALACGVALHLAAGADGAAARRALGAQPLVGQSCHGEAALKMAAEAGLDYATVSPIFPTASKPGYRSALTPAGWAALAGGAPLPVVALGGVTERTVPRLAGTGFAGVAMMGEAMTVADPDAWFGRVAALWPRATG